MKPQRPAQIRALLFDLDDTLWPIVPVIVRAESLLFDWLRLHAPAVAAMQSIASLRARRAELMAQDPRLATDLRALRHAGLCEAFQAAGAGLALVDEAMRVFSKARNEVTLFDDVADCLPRLARRMTLGSLTNGAAELDAIGLAQHFSVSLAAHELGRAKPDPGVFLAACDALGLAPPEVAYVGDDLLLDVAGAQRAGLTAVWMNRPGSPVPADLAHIRPDISLRSLYELEAWLSDGDTPADATGVPG